MINLILFGPPGAGKGTQAQYIIKEKKLVHISTGDIFRKNISLKTALGQTASSYMNKGQLVPDSVTIKLLESEIDSCAQSQGFIFDGFPRTLPQAEAFASFLNNKKMPLSLVISLEVSESKLVERLLKRGIDSGRVDDSNEDTIRARIQVYHQQTSILKKFYSDNLKKHFFEINGEREIEVISQDILGILKNY